MSYDPSAAERDALLGNSYAAGSYGSAPPPPPPRPYDDYDSTTTTTTSLPYAAAAPSHDGYASDHHDPGIIDYSSHPWYKRIWYWVQAIFSSTNEDDEPVIADPDNLTDSERQREIRNGIKLACMLIIGIIAIGAALSYLAFILVPLALARFFVYAAQPLINYLVGKKRICGIRLPLPRWIAVLITMLLIIALIAALIVALYFSILSLVHNGDKYTTRFNELYEAILTWAESRGFSKETVMGWLPEISLSELAVEFAAILYELIPAAVLCLLFTIYMLLDYNEKVSKTRLQREIDGRVRKYIIIKILVSVLVAALIGVVLFLMSVDMWFLFTILTFLFNFIPNVGSIVATFLPLPVVLFDPNQTWWSILIVFFVPAMLHFVIGNVLEPAILGTQMEISAVSVLVCLAYWSYIWGIVGAFISVPLTVMIQMWLYSIPHPMAIFLANLIGGKLSMSTKED